MIEYVPEPELFSTLTFTAELLLCDSTLVRDKFSYSF